MSADFEIVDGVSTSPRVQDVMLFTMKQREEYWRKLGSSNQFIEHSVTVEKHSDECLTD